VILRTTEGFILENKSLTISNFKIRIAIPIENNDEKKTLPFNIKFENLFVEEKCFITKLKSIKNIQKDNKNGHI
jgi:hypothetical protein